MTERAYPTATGKEPQTGGSNTPYQLTEVINAKQNGYGYHIYP